MCVRTYIHSTRFSRSSNWCVPDAAFRRTLTLHGNDDVCASSVVMDSAASGVNAGDDDDNHFDFAKDTLEERARCLWPRLLSIWTVPSAPSAQLMTLIAPPSSLTPLSLSTPSRFPSRSLLLLLLGST